MRGATRREFAAVNPPRRPLARPEATPSSRCPRLTAGGARRSPSRRSLPRDSHRPARSRPPSGRPRRSRLATARCRPTIEETRDHGRPEIVRTTRFGRGAPCSVLARRCRTSGPRDLRSLAVVGRRPTARGIFDPSLSSAHGADCSREPTAPSRLASPGERRSPELAAHGVANAEGRRVGGRFHRPPSNVAAKPPRGASPVQSTRSQLTGQQKLARRSVLIPIPPVGE